MLGSLLLGKSFTDMEERLPMWVLGVSYLGLQSYRRSRPQKLHSVRFRLPSVTLLVIHHLSQSPIEAL